MSRRSWSYYSSFRRLLHGNPVSRSILITRPLFLIEVLLRTMDYQKRGRQDSWANRQHGRRAESLSFIGEAVSVFDPEPNEITPSFRCFDPIQVKLPRASSRLDGAPVLLGRIEPKSMAGSSLSGAQVSSPSVLCRWSYLRNSDSTPAARLLHFEWLPFSCHKHCQFAAHTETQRREMLGGSLSQVV